MSGVFSEKWYEAYCEQHGIPYERPKEKRQDGDEGEKRSKYGNEKVVSEGMRFDSRHEKIVYEELRTECLAGEHVALARQVPFYLPGGVKYVADFVTLEADGSFHVLDAKSEATRKDKVYRIKKRLMKECRGIEIKEM